MTLTFFLIFAYPIAKVRCLSMNAVRSDSVDFFLGTTTPAGFKGYFEPLRREPGMQMYLIKSGPGCGKSTLMKRLAVKAEQKGEPIQRIHCASDRQSGRRHLSRQARRHRGRHCTPCHGAGRPGRRGAGGEPVPHTGRRRPPRPRRRGEAALRPEHCPAQPGRAVYRTCREPAAGQPPG